MQTSDKDSIRHREEKSFWQGDGKMHYHKSCILICFKIICLWQNLNHCVIMKKRKSQSCNFLRSKVHKNLIGDNGVGYRDKSFSICQENRLHLLHLIRLGAELVRLPIGQASEPLLYGGKAVRNPTDSARWLELRSGYQSMLWYPGIFPHFWKKNPLTEDSIT